jgi:hypothetical protein
VTKLNVDPGGKTCVEPRSGHRSRPLNTIYTSSVRSYPYDTYEINNPDKSFELDTMFSIEMYTDHINESKMQVKYLILSAKIIWNM